MIRRTLRPLAVMVLAGLAAAACDDSPESPSFFSGQTFTGTVVRQGSSSHNFTSQQSGPLVITVTSLAPATTMGLGLGAPGPLGCQLTGQAAIRQGDVLQPGTDVPAGTYCLVVFDIGNVTADATVAYSVHVFHK